MGELASHIDLPRHIDERIMGRLVTVRRWIRRGTLNMRIIIRRARAQIEKLDSQLGAKLDETKRLCQLIFQWVLRIHTERVVIWQTMREIFWDAGAECAVMRDA